MLLFSLSVVFPICGESFFPAYVNNIAWEGLGVGYLIFVLLITFQVVYVMVNEEVILHVILVNKKKT